MRTFVKMCSHLMQMSWLVRFFSVIIILFFSGKHLTEQMEDLALSRKSDETASCQDNPMSTGEFCHNSALQVVYWSKVHRKNHS